MQTNNSLANNQFKKRAKEHKRNAIFFLSLIIILSLFLLLIVISPLKAQVSETLDEASLSGNDTILSHSSFRGTDTHIRSNKEGDSLQIHIYSNYDSLKNIDLLVISNKSSSKIPLTIKKDGKVVIIDPQNDKDNSDKNQYDFTRDIILRILSSIIILFLIQFFFNLYKYHARLARYYLARADALSLGGSIKDLKFTDLVKQLSPDTYHIGNPKINYDYLIELLGLAKEKNENSPICVCCCKCNCGEKSKDKSDEPKAESE